MTAMKHIRTLCLLTALLAAFAGQALAGGRVALVIGNAKYDPAIGRLANPANDAKEMASLLKSLGFDVLSDTDLSRREMNGLIQAFESRAAQAEIALVFYSGHGMQFKDENWLVPVDARVGSGHRVAGEMIALSRLLKAVEHAEIGIVFLDACRNNPFGDAVAGNGNKGLAAVATSQLDGGVAGQISGATATRPPTVLRNGTLIGFAAAPNKVAYDGQGNQSPYTVALLHHLKMPDRPLSAALEDVAATVLEATDHAQRPWYNSSLLSNDVYLADLTRFVPARAPETLCDRLAANPDDPMKIGTARGAEWGQIEVRRAVQACLMAVSNHPSELRFRYQLARALHAANQYCDALQQFQIAAENGYVAAMHNLGYMRAWGQCEPQNYSESARWYRKAAGHGYATSFYIVGVHYEKGLVASGRNLDLAKYWYCKASSKGVSEAREGLRRIGATC